MANEELPPNKTEAIRRAVEALGYRASVDQILDYVRTHYERQTEAGVERLGAATTQSPPNTARRGKK